MVNGTIVASLLVEDGTPIVAPALPELLSEVTPNVPGKRELSDPVGFRPVVGVALGLVGFNLRVDDSEAAVGDSAELVGAESEGVGFDGNEFEDVGFGPAELKSPLDGEGLTGVKLKAAELEAPDGMVFVLLEIAESLLDSPMPPDENSEVKTLSVAVGVTVTLFSCLG